MSKSVYTTDKNGAILYDHVFELPDHSRFVVVNTDKDAVPFILKAGGVKDKDVKYVYTAYATPRSACAYNERI